jgi:hypothetical protein
VEALSAPASEDGPSHAFGALAVAIVTRRPSSNEGDHKYILATMAIDPRTATTLPPASTRPGAAQAIDLQHLFLLPTSYRLASLSRSGVFRARTRTRTWRDQDVQQPTSFVWSPTRPASRLCLRRRNPIHASPIWSGCWRDRLHGTLFKPKRIAGRETASRNKEVAP